MKKDNRFIPEECKLCIEQECSKCEEGIDIQLKKFICDLGKLMSKHNCEFPTNYLFVKFHGIKNEKCSVPQSKRDDACRQCYNTCPEAKDKSELEFVDGITQDTLREAYDEIGS